LNIVTVTLLCLVIDQLAYFQEATQREKANVGHDEIIWELRAAYAAFNRGDFDAAVAALDPKIEWTEPTEFPGGGNATGARPLRNI
jgi:hypothetical protein